MSHINPTYNEITTCEKIPYVIVHRSTKGHLGIEFENDSCVYYLQPGQKWLPHEVSGYHPFKPGDIVGVDPWLVKRLKVSVVIISKTRTFVSSRGGIPHPQVEILGLSLRWFAASYFSL
jgi:hypothetical protein